MIFQHDPLEYFGEHFSIAGIDLKRKTANLIESVILERQLVYLFIIVQVPFPE